MKIYKNKKITKEYLKKKITASAILTWLLIGFIGGAIFGHIIFQDKQKDVIKLTMVYSSEKSSWISESSNLFKEYWANKQKKDPSLKSIALDFQPYGSGDSLISLLNGEVKPVIWSPASTIWVPILNTKWEHLTHSKDLIVENYTRLIYSPVVIATWEDFYEEHPFDGFEDLHDLIVDNPELIKMAHTDPRSSNSGFMATIMLVSSKLNMDPKLMSVDNLTDPNLQEWMREIESAVIFYGKSTGFLGRYMRDQGPDAIQVAILYENLVQDFSLEAEKRHGQKMKAIYPEEGSLFSDHPFCILNAEWVSDEEKMVAEEFISLLNTKRSIIKAINTGFRPINSSILEEDDVHSIYIQSFNEDYGVTSEPSVIIELLPPSDGTVISKIPDLWLLTRNVL